VFTRVQSQQRGRCRRFENPADTTVVSEGIINALQVISLFVMKWQKQLKQLIKVSPIML
jgi:hypothetical protein